METKISENELIRFKLTFGNFNPESISKTVDEIKVGLTAMHDYMIKPKDDRVQVCPGQIGTVLLSLNLLKDSLEPWNRKQTEGNDKPV
jgi:hypothetical protein